MTGPAWYANVTIGLSRQVHPNDRRVGFSPELILRESDPGHLGFDPLSPV